MTRRRDRAGLRSFATIDVTPLVDLTFLLLIVFMITTPILERSVDVTPPAVDFAVIEDKPHRVITLNRSGEILMDGQVIGLDTLAAELVRLRSEDPELAYFVRADESRPYGEVMSIMKVARRAGVTSISLVTVPEDR